MCGMYLGAYSPVQVVREAISILHEKAHTVSELLQGRQRIRDAPDTTTATVHGQAGIGIGGIPEEEDMMVDDGGVILEEDGDSD